MGLAKYFEDISTKLRELHLGMSEFISSKYSTSIPHSRAVKSSEDRLNVLKNQAKLLRDQSGDALRLVEKALVYLTDPQFNVYEKLLIAEHKNNLLREEIAAIVDARNSIQATSEELRRKYEDSISEIRRTSADAVSKVEREKEELADQLRLLQAKNRELTGKLEFLAEMNPDKRRR